MFLTLLVIIFVLFLGRLRVLRLQAAGHIAITTPWPQVIWTAFVLPGAHVLWASMYEMLRTITRGRRQKPPLDAFLLAWVTQRPQPVNRTIAVTETNGQSRTLRVTEWVRPPRPPGRPRKHPQGWQAARRTGRPRGRPRKAVPPADGAGHDE